MKITSGSLTNYNKGIIANNRSWLATIKFYKDNSWKKLLNTGISSFTMSDYTVDGKNITFGSVMGSKLEVKFNKLTNGLLEQGTKIKFELKLVNSSVTLTSKPFVIDEMNLVKMKDGSYQGTITAYDITYLMTKTYAPQYGAMLCNEIVEDIAIKYGLTVNDSVYNAIYEIEGNNWSEFNIISDFTDKQTLGYIAGCYGCFAYINEDEEICFGWYADNGKSIAKSDVYENGVSESEANLRIYKMIESGTKDNQLVYPTQAKGYSVNFENPYITSAHVQAIYNLRLANDAVSFNIAKVKYRGDPLNGGAGSIVTARSVNGIVKMYVMKRTLYYDGGVYEVIESFGESESTINYKVASPTQQRIDRALSRMEEAIKKATDVITQTKGSVFELIPIDENDPSKGNSGWKLYSTQIGNNNLILANSSGIGFSNDGGETFGAAAIYIDENGVGHINGNYITAGSISADKIDTSQLVVGDNVSPDLETLLNGIVDKANNSVTNVDVLYGKNQSTTEPPTNWSTSAPVWEEGYYIWTKTQTTVGGETTETDPVCITGAKGETGVTGDTGQGVSAIEEQYYLSTSSTTQSGGSWSTTQPSWSSGKYIWTRSKITWVNPSATTYTTPVLAKAINGANEKANSAETKANATDLILGGLTAKENNVVYVKGSSILAGSIGADQIGANAITANKIAAGAITADKLTIGDATNYCDVNVITASTLGWQNLTSAEVSANANLNTSFLKPKSLVQSGSYILGDWVEFIYNNEDERKYLFQGKCYNDSAGEITVCMQIQDVDGISTVMIYGNTRAKVIASKAYAEFRATIVIPTTYNNKRVVKFRPCIWSNSKSSWIAISDFSLRRATAGDITAGKLRSVDGLTYFDLDNNTIVSTSADRKTEISEGVITASDLSASSKIKFGFENTYSLGGLLFPQNLGAIIAEVNDNNNVVEDGLLARFQHRATDFYGVFRINNKVVTPATLDWGTHTNVHSGDTIYFTNTFSKAPTVIATPLQSGASTYFVNVDVTSVTKSSFTVYFEDGRQSDLMWIAISQ